MVQGLAEFERRWNAIPGRVRAAVREEMERSAEGIVRDMRRVAPKRTGRLAASIGWTWGAAPDGSLVIGTVGGGEYGAMRITIYAGSAGTMVSNSRGKRFQLAKIMEFGTKAVPAHPFFFPVWRVRRRAVRTRISRAITKAIRN